MATKADFIIMSTCLLYIVFTFLIHLKANAPTATVKTPKPALKKKNSAAEDVLVKNDLFTLEDVRGEEMLPLVSCDMSASR